MLTWKYFSSETTMPALLEVLPGFLGPQMTAFDLDRYNLEDLARNALYLATTLVLCRSICIGFYRCMSLCYSSSQGAE